MAREYLRQHVSLPDIWLPVPLHPKIHRERGFNQAEELARPIASLTARPLTRFGVRRIKRTKSQKLLTSLERQSNMRNAFACELDLRGKTVAIVDDVVTTGATVTSLTSTLLEAGARDVQVVCAARTPAK